MRKRRNFTEHRFRWRWLVIVSLLVLGVLCYMLWQEFFWEHSQKVPDRGGIYTEATVGTIKDLNPLSPNSSPFDRDLQALLFEGLLRYNPLSGKIEAALGTLNVDDKGKNYTLTLNEGAKFSDGEEVDISDVLFTYDTVIKNPFFGNPDLRQSFEYVEISVVDKRTISFRLPEENIFFPNLLITPILPKKYFENVLIEEVLDPDFQYNKKPVGAGPFRLKNIVQEDGGKYRVFLESNPYYYRNEPYLEQMVFYVYPESKEMLEEHRFPTVFTRIPGHELLDAKEFPYEEYRQHEYVLPRFVGVFFNLDRAVPGNQNFRKAFFHAFPTTEVLEPGWKAFHNPLFREDLEILFPNADYALARNLLRDSGFPYNKQKEVRTVGAHGKPVNIKLITSTLPTVYSRFAQKLKNIWEKELDIEVDLKILSPEDFQVALKNQDYDAVLYGQNFARSFDVFSVWYSSQAKKLNLSNITRDDIDFLINEIRFSGTKSDYQSLQNKLTDLVPAIVFATPEYKMLISKKLLGFQERIERLSRISHRFASVHAWHFETKETWSFDENESKIWNFLRWIWKND